MPESPRFNPATWTHAKYVELKELLSSIERHESTADHHPVDEAILSELREAIRTYEANQELVQVHTAIAGLESMLRSQS